MRSLKIDFFRGLALIIIFIDHVYNNRLGGYTLRGYGVADAGEIFFFCSGFVAALVYGRVLNQSGFAAAQRKAVRRSVVIYLYHIGAFLVLAGLTVLLREHQAVETVVRARLLHEVIYGDPAHTLEVFTLQYQPFLFTILPAYMVLSLATPVFTRLLTRSPWLLFGATLALYVMVQLNPALNLPAGDGRWVFNPFAYQFLFALGMLSGTLWKDARLNIPMRLDLAAAAIVLLGIVFVFHNFIPFLQKHFQLFADYPYPRGLPFTGKVNEEPLRILHFLVLTYATLYLMYGLQKQLPRVYARLRALGRPVINCGQHSIQIFVLGLVLSYVGGYVIAGLGNGVGVWLPVNAAGIAILLTAGAWLARSRRRLNAAVRDDIGANRA